MASKCNNLEPRMNCTNIQDSLKDLQSVPSKSDLDNLFGTLYEEYHATSSLEVSDNSAANTLDNEHTYSSSSIVVEEYKSPQIVSSSAEQVATEPNSLVLNENTNDLVQQDVIDFNGNVFYNPPQTPVFEVVESSSTYQNHQDYRFELIAYSDADHAGCNDDYKSTSRGIQFLGDKLVSWSSKKQDCTTMSTVEADISHGSTSSCSTCSKISYSWRCNNYAVLQSIPCSPKCKIIGHILLDHPLNYALTAIDDVPVVGYVPRHSSFSNRNLENLNVEPVNIETIKSFMNMGGYQGMVDKDDIPLVSVYTTGDEIRATDDFKEYETVFMNVDVQMNQPQPIVSNQGMHRSTPRAHRTPTLTASPQGKKMKQIVGESTTEAQENVAKVQEKLDEEEIEKMVKGDEDEESYASAFANSMFNDDVDDSGTKIEPESHKEHPKHVTNDDEEIEKEKKDEEVEKEKEDVKIEKEKDIADDGTCSTKIRKEQKQTT
uniref:Gag-Pol polyprotein n=1 Tax=Tanacetum cinerariifolium TaxID=118510 RepID=A0A6L2M988_TANCI|nr:Gag-Pol polyprotein [Tanacetum cinerariifolium]